MSKKFVVREFEECEGGHEDEYGFYHTPNGSFWDADGFYFNREGKDKHGGYYDDNWEFVPGETWDKLHECYESDLDNCDDDDFNEDLDYEDDEADIFESYMDNNNKKKESDLPIDEMKNLNIKDNKNTNNPKPVANNNKAGGLKDLLGGSNNNNNKQDKPRPKTTRGGRK